jgi:hypothetical protein
VSVLDNLGKGASGAAVQNMNIALGVGRTVRITLGGMTMRDVTPGVCAPKGLSRGHPLRH